MAAMKRAHVPKTLAPAPRLTLWVPALIFTALATVWLAVLRLL